MYILESKIHTFSRRIVSSYLIFIFSFLVCISISSTLSVSSTVEETHIPSLFVRHCNSEAQRFCPKTHLKKLATPESVFDLPCFLRHQSELSNACKVYFGHWYSRYNSPNENATNSEPHPCAEAQNVLDSCEKDRKSFCPHLPTTLRTLFHSRCFLENLQEVSSTCLQKMAIYSDRQHVLLRRPSHEVWGFCQREPLLSGAVALCLFLIPILLTYICCGVCNNRSSSPSSCPPSPSKGRRNGNSKVFDDDVSILLNESSSTIPLVSAYSFSGFQEKRPPVLDGAERGSDAVSTSTLEM